MMQKYTAGQGPEAGNDIAREGRSAEEIREVIRTVENYLARTKETIERIERFMAELKEESRTAGERERSRENDEEKAKTSEPAYRKRVI